MNKVDPSTQEMFEIDQLLNKTYIQYLTHNFHNTHFYHNKISTKPKVSLEVDILPSISLFLNKSIFQKNYETHMSDMQD